MESKITWFVSALELKTLKMSKLTFFKLSKPSENDTSHKNAVVSLSFIYLSLLFSVTVIMMSLNYCSATFTFRNNRVLL